MVSAGKLALPKFHPDMHKDNCRKFSPSKLKGPAPESEVKKEVGREEGDFASLETAVLYGKWTRKENIAIPKITYVYKPSYTHTPTDKSRPLAQNLN